LFFAEIAESVHACESVRGVEFCGHNDHRFFSEQIAESNQFAVDDFESLNRIVYGSVTGVDQVNQQACAFDVAKKAVAEAGALMRAFNQAGEIGDYERAAEFATCAAGAVSCRAGSREAVSIDDAQIRFECSERIIRNFGPRGRDDGD
jgi:hypothetical protein